MKMNALLKSKLALLKSKVSGIWRQINPASRNQKKLHKKLEKKLEKARELRAKGERKKGLQLLEDLRKNASAQMQASIESMLEDIRRELAEEIDSGQEITKIPGSGAIFNGKAKEPVARRSKAIKKIEKILGGKVEDKLSLFQENEIESWLQTTDEIKTWAQKIEDGYLNRKPEEIVRQLYRARLIRPVAEGGYGYPQERVKIEEGIHLGSSTALRADIAVYDDKDYSKDKEKHIPRGELVIVEAKAPGNPDGRKQLESYCRLTGAPYGVWTNGQDIAYYHLRDLHHFDEIKDIPRVGEGHDDLLIRIGGPPPPQEGAAETRDQPQPAVLLTYDFSKIPDAFRLSGRHQLLAEIYYKYKPMLIAAQDLVQQKRISQALNYYQALQAQHIPEELRQMIGRNIEDIISYQKKALLWDRAG